VEAVPSAESLLEKKNRIERVSRKISVDPIRVSVEFAPRKLYLLMGSREVGQMLTQAVGSYHPGRKKRDFLRVLPGCVTIFRSNGSCSLNIFWKGAGAKSVGIPEVRPVAEWSKAKAILDKSLLSSKKSGSKSEEAVELRRAKEARGLEGKTWVTGPDSRGGRSQGGGGRIRSQGYHTRGQGTERAPGSDSRRTRGPFDGEIGASRGNISKMMLNTWAEIILRKIYKNHTYFYVVFHACGPVCFAILVGIEWNQLLSTFFLNYYGRVYEEWHLWHFPPKSSNSPIFRIPNFVRKLVLFTLHKGYSCNKHIKRIKEKLQKKNIFLVGYHNSKLS
jgi:hypothetical protein